MSWKKSSPELVATFASCLPADPSVERRQMFGYPCAFVAGNMVAGLHEERLMVRLADAEREALLALGGTVFEPMPGRPMKEYVVVPSSVIGEGRALAGWVKKAIAYGKTLPAKGAKKTSKARGKR